MLGNSLYSKMIVWLFFTLSLFVSVTLVFAGVMVFGSKDGVMPNALFSSKVEDVFRLISTNMQYRPCGEWGKIVGQYDRPGELRFHLVSLDAEGCFFTDGYLPIRLMQAALSIPRTPFTLCTDPVQVFSEGGQKLEVQEGQGVELGLPPAPPAMFMRAGDPPAYWFGRTLFVPDVNRVPHYLLLAVESPSFSGNGLFFNVRAGVLIFLGIASVSALFWLPFVWHIVRPVLRMADYAEKVVADPGADGHGPLPASATKRKDELGRLARSLDAMTRKLTQQVAGQRQFIRHIAHELNTPLSRCRLGLDLLEETTRGETRRQVGQVMQELEQLALLTDDVLAFLRAQSSPLPVKSECCELLPLLAELLSGNIPEGDVRVDVPEGLRLWGDRDCMGRAIGNVLRNAVAYAGDDGPVEVFARFEPARNGVEVCVRDYGGGVEDVELASLTEPFFRGAAAQLNHPGGSGLGLAIVKSAMEQCGGEMRCANESPGFSVRLFFPSPQAGKACC